MNTTLHADLRQKKRRWSYTSTRNFFWILLLTSVFGFASKPVPADDLSAFYASLDACEREEIMAASIQPVKSGLWINASTWPGGKLPTINDDVTIPAGMTVTLHGNCEAKSVTVNGTLNARKGQVNGAWANLKTRYIMVMGPKALMEIGTESQPYISKFPCRITLVGSNPNEMIPGTSINSKAVMVMSGGRLELHGAKQKSWVKIGKPFQEGVTSITLAEAVDWETGDWVVVSSNRLDPAEAEVRKLTGISNDKRTIYFNGPMAYPRNGIKKVYSRPNSTKKWTVDTRAEVGLLSRNIIIQGDETSPSNGFGGHLMIMPNSVGNAENIELYRMGQKAILARYPWHWHMLGDQGYGQYIKNSSIHRSFNRAVTIHGTWGTLVDNNVAYDHVGHGIFLEDGSEIDNVMSNNLVLLTKRPASEEEALLESDFNHSKAFQGSSPASFWITNPANKFINNVVAGSEGTAYWFALAKKPTGKSADDPRFKDMEPYKLNIQKFDGNVAHSCINGIDLNDQVDSDHVVKSNRRWENSKQAVFNDLTFFSNYFSLYSGIGDSEEDVVYNNIVSTDAITHLNFATMHIVQNSILIADTERGLLDRRPFDVNGTPPGNRLCLYRLYDGAARLYDSHLVGWNKNLTSFVLQSGGAMKRINHLFKGLTYDHEGPVTIKAAFPGKVGANLKENKSVNHCSQLWSNVLRDLDGTLTRTNIPSSIVPDIPFYNLAGSYVPENWSGMRSVKQRYLYIRLTDLPMKVVRRHIECDELFMLETDVCNVGPVQQLHLPVDSGKYEHSLYFLESINEKKVEFSIRNSLVSGDALTVRFKGFGKLKGVRIDGLPANAKKNTIAQVKASNSSSYCVADGDLYTKFITSTYFDRKNFYIKWDEGKLPITDVDESTINKEETNCGGTLTDCKIIPYAQINSGIWEETKTIRPEFGETVTISPHSEEFGPTSTNWSWEGPKNFSSDKRTISLENIRGIHEGTYTVTYTNPRGCTATEKIRVLVNRIQDGKIYEMQPQHQKTYRLQVKDGSNANETTVQIGARTNQKHEHFKFIKIERGVYELQPQHAPGKRVDVYGKSTADNARIVSWASNQGLNQRWHSIPLGGGLYHFEPMHAPGKRLDVENNGNDAMSRKLAGRNSQRWRLIEAKEPDNTVVNCTYGTPRSSGIPALDQVTYSSVHVVGNRGPELNNFRKFTINWNPTYNGLYQFAINTSNGSPGWYVDFSDSMNFQLKNTNPEVTLRNTGFAGLDGSYWINLTSNSLILVSKDQGYSVHFSNVSTEPSCTDKNNTDLSALDIKADQNPFTDVLTLSGLGQDAFSAALYNINGQQILRKSIDNGSDRISFDTRSLSQGVYFAKVIQSGITQTIKVVKR